VERERDAPATFAGQPSFEKYARKRHRERFLNTMESVVPWGELEALIEPHYPKAGKGHHPVALGTMLRNYFLQHRFNLSDPGAEDALYELPVLRGFAGVDLGRMAVSDETTILNFRHLLQAHDLCGEIFDVVNHCLDRNGIRISTGTIIDATIIPAPSSTKNANKERDPEMHQTRKGNQYYFGAKAHIGVDSKEGIVHSVCTSAASVHDKHMLPDLLHDEEKKVWGDGGYPRPNCDHPRGSVRCAGNDQPARQEQQGRCRRRPEAEEQDQVACARQGGVALSHLEACLRIYQGPLSRHRKEPSMASGGLRSGQPVRESEAAGPSMVIVSL
jgi:IS5 family transposase